MAGFRLSKEAESDVLRAIEGGEVRVYDYDAPPGKGISETGRPEWNGMVVIKEDGEYRLQDVGFTSKENYIKRSIDTLQIRNNEPEETDGVRSSLLSQLRREYLTPDLQLIWDFVGADVVVRLLENLPGVRLYIPSLKHIENHCKGE